tara:strand:- start:5170 stop:5334 length:165 start_codon:yes stop_codon:yes gene_type:complete
MIKDRDTELYVQSDLPETPEITSEELALIETYMRALVSKICNAEAANDNDEGMS